MIRDWRSSLGFAVVLASASPLFRPARADSYPLSTYPMFARILDKPWLTVAEGVAPGRVVRLPPQMIGTDQPMQAMRTLRLVGRSSRSARKALCASTASRVARESALSDVEEVRIVRARFDPLTYFEGAAEPEERERLVRCEVKREP